MSVLRSTIEEVTSTDLSWLSDGDLAEEAVELSRAIDILTHRVALISEEARTRSCFRKWGFLNVTRWLAHTTDVDDSTARHLVGIGRALADHGDTARLATDGDVSRTRVRILSRAANAHPDHYRRDEEMLLEFAATLSVTDFRKAVVYWSNCADAERAELDAARQIEATALHASKTFGGMVRTDGLFDPEGGEIILQALDAAMTPEAREDGASGDLRAAPLRRADALVHICKQYLASFPGVVGGHRPHATLIVDLETLRGGDGRRCDLSRTGTITPETARRILCDADVSRIIVAGDSVPLDLGRSVRTATPAQRRALAVRDGGCVREGCDRPPEWTDVHHKTHWIDGGKTDLDDLELLCRPHHIEEHEKDTADRGPPSRR